MKRIMRIWKKNNLGSYVKYNKFHWEKKRKIGRIHISPENLAYDKKTDSFYAGMETICSMWETEKYVTEAGYETRRECKKTEKPKAPAIFAPAE
ncbi:MAG: hypothetical protein ACLR23_09585 [Clostridia bacterium]